MVNARTTLRGCPPGDDADLCNLSTGWTTKPDLRVIPEGSKTIPDGTWGAPTHPDPMPSHTSVTQRLDAPTIAFDRQPTVSVSVQALARDLYDGNTASTLRPVLSPLTREVPVEVPTITSMRAATGARNGRGMFALCTLCLVLGVVAGHLVREGDAYGAALSSATAKLHGSPRARAAHGVDVVGAHAALSGVRNKDVPAALAKSEGRTPPAKRAKASSSVPAVANPADALFIDFEPTFRAPK